MDSAIPISETALLLCDLQNDFIHPEGAYARGGQGDATIAALPARLAPLCQALQLGDVRGVRQALAQREQDHPAQAALWTQWRGLVQQFDMDGLARAGAQQQATGVGQP